MTANLVQEHTAGGTRLYLRVWVGLLALTLLEVFFAYQQFPVTMMLVLLMGTSVIKAALIVAYFMHLRFERLSLFLTLVPMGVLCMLLLLMFFPDSLRLHDLRFPK